MSTRTHTCSVSNTISSLVRNLFSKLIHNSIDGKVEIIINNENNSNNSDDNNDFKKIFRLNYNLPLSHDRVHCSARRYMSEYVKWKHSSSSACVLPFCGTNTYSRDTNDIRFILILKSRQHSKNETFRQPFWQKQSFISWTRKYFSEVLCPDIVSKSISMINEQWYKCISIHYLPRIDRSWKILDNCRMPKWRENCVLI